MSDGTIDIVHTQTLLYKQINRDNYRTHTKEFQHVVMPKYQSRAGDVAGTRSVLNKLPDCTKELYKLLPPFLSYSSLLLHFVQTPNNLIWLVRAAHKA